MYVPKHLRADVLWKNMKVGKRKTHLYLTGGGALGSFQAGQLIGLLLGAEAVKLFTLERAENFLLRTDDMQDILKAMPEAWFKLSSLSGVSAGACNLAILGTYLSQGQGKLNRLEAAVHLIIFWLKDVPSMPSQLFYGRFYAMGKLPTNMKSWLSYMNLMTKPVPAEINPIIHAVEKHADFDRIRTSSMPMYVAVTDVISDSPLILTNQNLDARMIAASGAIEEWGMQAVDGLGEGAYHHNPYMPFLHDDKERSDKDPECALLLRLDHGLVAPKKRTSETRMAASTVKMFHAPVKRDIDLIRRKNKKEGRVLRLFESGLKRSHKFSPEDKADTSADFLSKALAMGLAEGIKLLNGMPYKRI